jgi:hypothetical protein
MPSLTGVLKRPNSSVSRWMRSTFPGVEPFQQTVREATDDITILPPVTSAPGTQGAALEWCIRILVDRRVSVELAARGLGRRRDGFVTAAQKMLHELAPDGETIDPERHRHKPDEWWARTVLRSGVAGGALSESGHQRIAAVPAAPEAKATDLWALASQDAVADLSAMRDLARTRLLPQLRSGPLYSGIDFGSRYLAADADLIAAWHIDRHQGGSRRQAPAGWH